MPAGRHDGQRRQKRAERSRRFIPGAQAFNGSEFLAHILATFVEAHELISN
jgi:hypothetical protein